MTVIRENKSFIDRVKRKISEPLESRKFTVDNSSHYFNYASSCTLTFLSASLWGEHGMVEFGIQNQNSLLVMYQQIFFHHTNHSQKLVNCKSFSFLVRDLYTYVEQWYKRKKVHLPIYNKTSSFTLKLLLLIIIAIIIIIIAIQYQAHRPAECIFDSFIQDLIILK